jgi:hypothetical protein
VAAQAEPGTLSIVAPAGVDLDAPVPGTTETAAVGAVTVVDDRAEVAPGWIATVSATDLTTGSATGAETIPAAALAYASGPATATSGTATFTPGQPTVDDAVGLGDPVEAFRVEDATDPTTATWSPTLLLSVPAAAVAGAYTGTLTHSVA